MPFQNFLSPAQALKTNAWCMTSQLFCILIKMRKKTREIEKIRLIKLTSYATCPASSYSMSFPGHVSHRSSRRGILYHVGSDDLSLNYFFLWRSLLILFLRLCFAIFALFLLRPHGMNRSPPIVELNLIGHNVAKSQCHK